MNTSLLDDRYPAKFWECTFRFLGVVGRLLAIVLGLFFGCITAYVLGVLVGWIPLFIC